MCKQMGWNDSNGNGNGGPMVLTFMIPRILLSNDDNRSDSDS